MKRSIGFVVALGLVLGAAYAYRAASSDTSSRPAAPDLPGGGPDHEAAVQSAVLATLFDNSPMPAIPPPPPATAIQDQDKARRMAIAREVIRDSLMARRSIRLLVVESSTVNRSASGGLRYGSTPSVGRLPGLLPATLDDYHNSNLRPRKLTDALRPGKPVKLLTKQEYGAFFSGDSKDESWRRFHAAFPRTNGIAELSRVGFDPTHTQALVYMGNRRGPLWGIGMYYLLERAPSGWTVKHSAMSWES